MEKKKQEGATAFPILKYTTYKATAIKTFITGIRVHKEITGRGESTYKHMLHRNE